ncbi:acyl-CoA thioester hydrolase [Sphingomonas zeicaulis]|uniref:acyl-CoA thioesterase n=1 Tax=Sphingomonas zeicaulis TaxID=1632740 RepID=UPI003D1E282D
MPKPAAWRLDVETYPFAERVTTRFQDLDPHGHINNVAMAAIFENGRVRFNRNFVHHKVTGQRWLVAAVAINYVEEAHFPADVIVSTGVGTVGQRSWSLLAAAFQNGSCVATCDATLVISGAEHNRAISPELRSALEGLRLREPA